MVNTMTVGKFEFEKWEDIKELRKFKNKLDEINANTDELLAKYKRRKKVLIVDVETIGVSDKSCYDVAYAIVDQHGVVYQVKSFVVDEVYNNREKMEKAYYYKKFYKYSYLMKMGIYTMKTISEIQDEINSDIAKFNVKVFSAYNSNFDVGALNQTLKDFNLSGIQYPETQECIWAFSTGAIMNKRGYRKFAKDNGKITASGKFYSSSAESCYSYMINNPNYTEEHIGLFDIAIEWEIFFESLKKKGKYDRKP
ncbi:MAG: hypothetical protein ACRC5M_03580, partial [Anaeroplasmataceae bacterium]